MKRISVKPIGIAHNRFDRNEISNSIVGVEGTIEVFEEYSEGLDCIEGFSHLIIISFLDRIETTNRKVLKMRFRRPLRYGMTLEEIPEVGIFCSDSPRRPVPIAITIVELVKRDNQFLHVKRFDLLDKTPILDIKPYTPDRVVDGFRLPEWYERLVNKVSEGTGVKNPCL
jgi:tRNA-Thr(GGU) m(6)t(6)A37 methyltransferase TsaA